MNLVKFMCAIASITLSAHGWVRIETQAQNSPRRSLERQDSLPKRQDSLPRLLQRQDSFPQRQRSQPQHQRSLLQRQYSKLFVRPGNRPNLISDVDRQGQSFQSIGTWSKLKKAHVPCDVPDISISNSPETSLDSLNKLVLYLEMKIGEKSDIKQQLETKMSVLDRDIVKMATEKRNKEKISKSLVRNMTEVQVTLREKENLRNDWQSKLDAVVGKLKSVDDAIKAAQQQIANGRKGIRSINNICLSYPRFQRYRVMVGTYTRQKSQLVAEKERIERQLPALNARLGELKRQLDALNRHRQRIDAEISSVNRRIVHLNSFIRALDVDLKGLRMEKSKMISLLNDLKTEKFNKLADIIEVNDAIEDEDLVGEIVAEINAKMTKSIDALKKLLCAYSRNKSIYLRRIEFEMIKKKAMKNIKAKLRRKVNG